MRTEFLCISVLRVATEPRVKLASCKSALNPTVVYSTDRSKAVVPVLVLLFVVLWFTLRGVLIYVLPCVILFLCFSVLLALRLPRLGKRELFLVLFVRLLDLRLFVTVALPGLFLLPFLIMTSSSISSSVLEKNLFKYFTLYGYLAILLVSNIFANLKYLSHGMRNM